jgi:hypothetical protein
MKAESSGPVGLSTSGQRHLLSGFILLTVVLLVGGGVGLSMARIWPDPNVFRAAVLGWLLTSVGTLISWAMTIRCRGPMMGLWHLGSGFLLRGLIPLGAAAILTTTNPDWRRAGLIWWMFSFFCWALIADTLIFIRILRRQGAA